jgi:5'-nucleotidase
MEFSTRKRRRLALSVLAGVIATGLVVPGAAADEEPEVAFWLTVIHNNDGESDLVNLGTDFLEDFGGVARFATVVDELKTEAIQGPQFDRRDRRGWVMVSSGDNFLAGPEFGVSLDNGPPFFDTIAMDLIGYDAVAIGNHDFDFGPDVLADFIEGYELTNPPYLSSNLDFSAEPRLQALVRSREIAKSVIIRERGQRIGIIGATTPALPFISSPRNVVVNEVAPAVQAEVARLQSRAVDKIILISHLQSIEEDLALATELTGLDIMVAGGGDELLANDEDVLIPADAAGTRPTPFGTYPIIATDADGRSVPVVTTQGSYAYVGNLLVGFDADGEVVAVDDEYSRPVRVAADDCGGTLPCDDAVAPDADVQSQVVDPLLVELEELAANVIATTEVDLDGTRTNVRTVETNEGNLIADSLLWQASELAGSFGVDTPVVALQNGGGIRNASVIPAGDLTELDTFSMVPFPNFVAVVEDVPRDQFKDILENAVSRVEFVDGRFAQIAGFSYTWDATGTPMVIDDVTGEITQQGSRVVSVVLDDGTVVVENGAVVAGDPIDVATIDFLAKGGDEYPYEDLPFTTLGATYQQALANYLIDGVGGVVTAADYPSGGEGRITRLN